MQSLVIYLHLVYLAILRTIDLNLQRWCHMKHKYSFIIVSARMRHMFWVTLYTMSVSNAHCVAVTTGHHGSREELQKEELIVVDSLLDEKVLKLLF